jgi:hypothetical protein
MTTDQPFRMPELPTICDAVRSLSHPDTAPNGNTLS